LFAGELFGERPVRIVALEDGVAVAIELSGRVGAIMVCRRADNDGIFGFALEVRGQDLTVASS